ncbi:hypothetical protein BD560DRAFT_169813 [Blakeslea trispora]|nr:hypothetical protein BD560DRAFT_169813 [Blakeslea trispora]
MKDPIIFTIEILDFTILTFLVTCVAHLVHDISLCVVSLFLMAFLLAYNARLVGGVKASHYLASFVNVQSDEIKDSIKVSM